MTWDIYDLTEAGDASVCGWVSVEGIGAAVDAARMHYPGVLALALAPRGLCAPSVSGLLLGRPALVMLVDGVIVVHERQEAR